MAEKLTCPICGEPTVLVYGKYPRKDGMCKKHSLMVLNKELEQCKDCGRWHNVGEKCECQTPAQKTVKKAVKETASPSTDELTCIICGEPSNGKHFCVKCYHKYKNKIIYLKIKDCVEYDPLGFEYESDLVCEDGHIVKSEPERNIDNWLFNHDIKHIYERTYQVNETVKLRPDWCLPGYIKDEDGRPIDVYVEYWGIEGSIKYENIKNYKLPIYQQEGLTLVNINAEQDKRDISAALDWKIWNKKNIKPYQINFLK